MRIVRRASLVLSLTLIVAIAVGYVARRSEVAHQRDLELTTAAQLGASQMSSIIDAIEIAATTGTDARVIVDALVANQPSLGVCAISATDESCGGAGPAPAPEIKNEHRQLRATGSAVDRRVNVIAYENSITIDVAGPTISVIAVLPSDSIGNRADVSGEIRMWATAFVPTTYTPSPTGIDEFVVDRGVRQTAIRVLATPELFVVAGTEDGIPLPAQEWRFYVLIFTLSVVLLMLAGATLIIEQRSLVERASFDPLTKLPNRGEFERLAAEAIAVADRQGTGLCVLLFDLDGFKLVNDTYGHFAGDEMLKVVGSRLRTAVRDDDIVARWGGDEFVVVMPGIGDDEMAMRRARQLAEQISGRTRLDGVTDALRVKLSVGVAIWPHHGPELAQLVEAADQAMYHAKRDGQTYRLAEIAPPPADPATISA